MAASVLGKRSRRVIDAEDIAPTLPAAKRRSRHATTCIYEDDLDPSAANAATKIAPLKSQVPRSTRLSRPKRGHSIKSGQDKTHNEEHTTKMQDTENVMDVENMPPSTWSTPTTVRHKDFLNVKVPSTPKHRVRPAGLSSVPRSLHKGSSIPQRQSVFSRARQLFTQSSNPAKLVGRETERQQIRQFVSEAIQSRKGGCTYISGPPGTGKSALVQEVLHGFEQDEAVQVSTINCVSLRTANDVYSKLLQDLCPNTTVGRSNLQQHLSNLFLKKPNEPMRLVLLDEIDTLLDIDCEVLYTIFEWAMRKSSSMVLVGIANALDLTDRFLPRLKAKGFKPTLLPFLPYTALQVSTIISDKLRSLLPADTIASPDFVPLMQPAAIQLCGKKIASQTGDLRKAFSLVRRIIDQVEKDAFSKIDTTPSKKPLGEISNFANLPPTPASSPLHSGSPVPVSFTIETAPRATIAHAARMASSIFNNGTLSRLTGLNLQQKAVLCSLVSSERRRAERNTYVTPSKSTNKTPSVKELFIKYTALCKRDEGLLQPLKDTEFRDVIASLETLGLIHEQKGRGSSLLTPTNTPSRAGRNHDDKQIVSAVSEKEMRESLGGPGADLLQRLLDEDRNV